MYSILYAVPGSTPTYTEDGITRENPAVGYSNVMLASSCSEEDAGLFGKACLWAHGDLDANMTAMDNE